MPVSTTDLDFFDIKNNLKSFLKNQSQFTDYDFEGSAMSTLIDVLAYNTHYNAMTASMVVNEMFIDTAQVRNNVVSLAKSLGYTPRSVKAASARVLLTGVSSLDSVTISRGTAFKGEDSDTTFVTLSDHVGTVGKDTGIVSIPLDIYEGKLITHKFTVTEKNQIFKIPNAQCDTNTIRVVVYESSESDYKNYFTFSKNIIDSIYSEDIATDTEDHFRGNLAIDPGKNYLFFVQEGSDEKHEVYFGDDILGAKLDIGNVVEITYLKCGNRDYNNISSFALLNNTNVPIVGVSSVNIETVTKSVGGSPIESIKSIKKNAPYVYVTQNRAVTALDYKAILNHDFNHLISDVSVWGGENNIPPEYGKIFFSVIPAGPVSILNDVYKEQIVKGMEKYKVTSIIPEFIDPDYIYLDLEVSYNFNPLKTNKTSNEISTTLVSAIEKFNTEELKRFNIIYYNSDITGLIKDTDISVLSATVKHKASKNMLPILGTAHRYNIKFNNAIYNPHQGHTTVSEGGIIFSSGFTLAGSSIVHYLEDDGRGNIMLYNYLKDGKKYSRIMGKVDYELGIITTEELIITSIIGNLDTKLLLTVELDSYDIVPMGEDIVIIDNIQIEGVEHLTSGFGNLSKINYKTSPYRL